MERALDRLRTSPSRLPISHSLLGSILKALGAFTFVTILRKCESLRVQLNLRFNPFISVQSMKLISSTLLVLVLSLFLFPHHLPLFCSVFETKGKYNGIFIFGIYQLELNVVGFLPVR